MCVQRRLLYQSITDHLHWIQLDPFPAPLDHWPLVCLWSGISSCQNIFIFTVLSTQLIFRDSLGAQGTSSARTDPRPRVSSSNPSKDGDTLWAFKIWTFLVTGETGTHATFWTSITKVTQFSNKGTILHWDSISFHFSHQPPLSVVCHFPCSKSVTFGQKV